MYSHCLFCSADLGRNDVIESFTVGRRLAFDAEKGRLWAVCARCERWNLTPLETRWEAIEEAERLYRGTPLRVATDNIGLARAADGTALIRIGRPQRPEMAAWRYGDQFGRRRRRTVAAGLIATGVVGGAGLVLLPLGGFAAGAMLSLLGSGAYGAFIMAAVGARSRGQLVARWIPDGTGHHLLIGSNEYPHVRLAPAAGDDGWCLRVPYVHRSETKATSMRTLFANAGAAHEASLTGPAAREAARRLLPLVNGWGAPRGQVQDAVRVLEEWRGPEHAFAAAAARVREYGAKQSFGDTGSLQYMPKPVRLALEMAAHEEQERLALESELAELERAWREAEEIASIADDLLLPDGVRSGLERLRRRVRGDD